MRRATTETNAKPAAKPKIKSPHADEDDASTSFQRLGGRQRAEQDDEQDQRARSNDAADEGEDDGGGDSPSMQERAKSGMKAASHLGKAARGGKLRAAFSLWRASKHLPVAAAGAGRIVTRHPAASALVGGAATAVAIYLLASRAAETSGDVDEASQGQEGAEAEDEARGEENED